MIQASGEVLSIPHHLVKLLGVRVNGKDIADDRVMTTSVRIPPTDDLPSCQGRCVVEIPRSSGLLSRHPRNNDDERHVLGERDSCLQSDRAEAELPESTVLAAHHRRVVL